MFRSRPPFGGILENVNGTKYRLCTIEVVNPKTGELFQTTAQIYDIIMNFEYFSVAICLFI